MNELAPRRVGQSIVEGTRFADEVNSGLGTIRAVSQRVLGARQTFLNRTLLKADVLQLLFESRQREITLREGVDDALFL